MEQRETKVELVLPFKAEFVSIARLTVSGIASRMGFDIETTEDIKVALSEVCNKIVTMGSRNADCYRIKYRIIPDRLVIEFCCDDKSIRNIFGDEDELGMSIIEVLMDDVNIEGGENFILSISKKLEQDG